MPRYFQLVACGICGDLRPCVSASDRSWLDVCFLSIKLTRLPLKWYLYTQKTNSLGICNVFIKTFPNFQDAISTRSIRHYGGSTTSVALLVLVCPSCKKRTYKTRKFVRINPPNPSNSHCCLVEQSLLFCRTVTAVPSNSHCCCSPGG